MSSIRCGLRPQATPVGETRFHCSDCVMIITNKFKQDRQNRIITNELSHSGYGSGFATNIIEYIDCRMYVMRMLETP